MEKAPTFRVAGGLGAPAAGRGGGGDGLMAVGGGGLGGGGGREGKGFMERLRRRWYLRETLNVSSEMYTCWRYLETSVIDNAGDDGTCLKSKYYNTFYIVLSNIKKYNSYYYYFKIYYILYIRIR